MSEDSVENNINEYYKLKSKYDSQNQKNKQKILNNRLLSIKEKKAEFKQLKPKCVNCGKPGGTTFASVFNKEGEAYETFRELRAFCNAVEPCGLNINIAVGHFENINTMLREIDDEIYDYKREIINDKNKLLFGLITTRQALDNFEIHKESITDFTSLLEKYLQEYIQITDNPETKEKMREELEKSYLQIQEIKHSIANFNTTNDIQFIRDAVNIYITNLKPTLSKLLKLKYKENSIWYNENNNTYHLIQNKYSIKDMETNLGKYETIAFSTSLQGEPVKRKLIIESSSSSAPSVEEDIIGQPTFNEDGTVTWSNKNYQSLWNTMDEKLRNALLSDRDWLQEFMNSCVKARLEGKPCQFTNPSNLIIPPQLLDDETYDFGNPVYNNFFTKLGKGYQKILLTVFKEKNGVKDYEPFIYQIGTMLAKELNFGKGYFDIVPVQKIKRVLNP
jgi:hypothetical protein